MKNISSIANSKGFTLIELMVVIGILAILLGLTTLSLTSVQQKTSINTTVQTIISDMKEQQIKAMIGDTEGRSSSSSYGIHFDADKYVLFHGAYDAGEQSNFVVALPSTLKFTTSKNIIFSQVEGRLVSADSVTVRSTSNNEEREIELNVYGVVIAVN